MEEALGLGYSPQQFEAMRVRNLLLHIRWHEKQHQKQADLIRLQTLYLINPHLKKPIDDARDLWAFEWDEPKQQAEPPKELTPEEVKAHNAKMMAHLKQLG